MEPSPCSVLDLIHALTLSWLQFLSSERWAQTRGTPEPPRDICGPLGAPEMVVSSQNSPPPGSSATQGPSLTSAPPVPTLHLLSPAAVYVVLRFPAQLGHPCSSGPCPWPFPVLSVSILNFIPPFCSWGMGPRPLHRPQAFAHTVPPQEVPEKAFSVSTWTVSWLNPSSCPFCGYSVPGASHSARQTLTPPETLNCNKDSSLASSWEQV